MTYSKISKIVYYSIDLLPFLLEEALRFMFCAIRTYACEILVQNYAKYFE